MQFEKLDKTKIGSSFWCKRNDQPGQNSKKIKIIVTPERKFQKMKGIGGAFSEIGGKALLGLSETKRDEVLKALFSLKGGNLSFCRMPVGCNDFSLSEYSYNDVKNDFKMEHFSIERDNKYLLPFIKMAQKFNPYLTLHASPWSPPYWLKDNASYVNGGSLIDDDKVYNAYALYLAKYIKAYSEQNITIERILPQNEPDSPAYFPGCVMEPWQMIKFVCGFLKPMFSDMEINTEIWAGTFRSITGMWAYDCAKQMGNDVAGFGFQYITPNYLNDFKRLYSQISIMHTESVCYHGENIPEFAFNLFYDFIDYIEAGCDNFTYWNMVLPQPGRSTWGWTQNSMITITEHGEIVYNPDYFVMKELGQNIEKGAHRIDVFCHTKRTIAFENPDGSIVLFLSNIGDETQEGIVEIGHKQEHFTLPPYSFKTLKYKVK